MCYKCIHPDNVESPMSCASETIRVLGDEEHALNLQQVDIHSYKVIVINAIQMTTEYICTLNYDLHGRLISVQPQASAAANEKIVKATEGKKRKSLPEDAAVEKTLTADKNLN